MVKIRLLAALTLGTLGGFGCGDGALKPDDTRTVAVVTVTPTIDTVLLGSTITFGAVATNPAGDPIVGQTFTWTTLNQLVATVGPERYRYAGGAGCYVHHRNDFRSSGQRPGRRAGHGHRGG